MIYTGRKVYDPLTNTLERKKYMRDNRKFADNEIVYVNSTYNIAEKCKITKFVQKESRVNKPVYALHSLDNYGSFAATEDCIFKTKEDAIKSYKTSSNKLVEKYKNEIRTLEELIKFPLSHCIACGEEYTEEEAREAYKIRAKEITGILL
ncbi:hypothetical protein [Lachnospira multipara]|uniref:Uncharacterized protein n=1 Tax=Lachnospira multipara TaxID=28051 RepID=A0A1H5VVP1_9FIRM|nr:hypothetical protein [Lachnospira multipara]SEF90931.1 hypothetical protein SAMN05216537_112108 [Lachnospira multipara]